MKQVTLSLKNRSTLKSNLHQVAELGSEEIPNYLLKETKQNTYLELNLNQNNKIKILDKEIDLMKVVNDSVYYKFCEWLINDYFYLLNSSGNTITLKQIYTYIPAIETIKFYETLAGEDNNDYEFSIVTHGKLKGESTKKILFLIHVGNGERTDVESFINKVTQVKKYLLKTGDIGAAIFISTSEYTQDTLRLFSERTPEPKKSFLLSSLDSSAKFKGFVKLAHGKGFHLNLIEYQQQEDIFTVIAPSLT